MGAASRLPSGSLRAPLLQSRAGGECPIAQTDSDGGPVRIVPYRFLDHTADVGLVVQGRDADDLFGNAVAGLSDLLFDRAAVRERSSREIAVDSPGAPPDELLRELLTEVLFLFHARGFACARAELSVSEGSVRGRLFGEPFDRDRHGGRLEVKGATFHALSLRKAAGPILEATVIFDV